MENEKRLEAFDASRSERSTIDMLLPKVMDLKSSFVELQFNVYDFTSRMLTSIPSVWLLLTVRLPIFFMTFCYFPNISTGSFGIIVRVAESPVFYVAFEKIFLLSELGCRRNGYALCKSELV